MQIDRPIAIALIIFVIILLIFFLVAPAYQNFKDLQVQLAEKKAEYNAEFAYYNQIEGLYADLQVRKDEIVKIDDALPSESNLGQLVYFLQKESTDNGLILKSLSLSKMSSESGAKNQQQNAVGDIVFSLSMMGDYPALENFIKSLEKSSRIFEIGNIAFGSSELSSGSSPSPVQTQQGYSFNIQVTTHSY